MIKEALAMGIGVLLLLAVLVSLDSFYSGLVYKKEWGNIDKEELLLIFIHIIVLITITTSIGRLIFILVGEKLIKLINLLILGSISIVFYIIMQRTRVKQPENKFKKRILGSNLQFKKVKIDKKTTLFELGLITSIDVAMVSFIVATLTSQIIQVIVIFSCIDLIFIKLGNLIPID